MTLQVCAAPGCGAIVERGRCDAHKRERWKRYEEVRPERDRAFYNSPAWRAARRAVILAEPVCRDCRDAGRVTVAVQVDHIQRWQDGGAPLDPANLRPLCLSCHSRRTLADSRAAGKLVQP
jgi:5-methylcytosine-specific restriction protein A